MSDYKKLLISPVATIRQAMAVIDQGAMKIALVVDGEQKLLGTVSDGDVRRAILKGVDLDEPIENIYFRSPTTCGVSDSKEQVLQLAAAHKLYQIPVVDAAGRVVGIATIDELVRPSRRTNKVVLMAGGVGSRLRPLTDTTPKPMLHVGKKPILETIIDGFTKYGYQDIILSVSYKSHIIEQYFGDGSAFGANIQYVHEEKPMGTAGALALMRPYLTEPFFVMNGDLLTNVNYAHLHDYHNANSADATMAIREYDFQIPYGVVKIQDGRIEAIKEKPVHKFFVSAGICMLSPQSLDLIPDDQFLDMPALFDKLIASNRSAISFPIREYWLDIGRMSDYERANHDYAGVFSDVSR